MSDKKTTADKEEKAPKKDNGKERWGVDVYQEDAITGGVLTLGHNSQGVVGFYKYNGAVVPPYRAYLTSNTVTDAKDFCLFVIDDNIDDDFIEGVVTHINDASQPTAREDVYYDMTGRKLPGKPTRHGIYIVNGKKRVF